MAKERGKQHAVQSSNLKSVGFYISDDPNPPVIRIEFQRSASYDYWPCTEVEFQEAFTHTSLKDWFAKIKIGKQFKKV